MKTEIQGMDGDSDNLGGKKLIDDEGRRHFFRDGFGAVLTGFLGLGVLNVFSQTKPKGQPRETNGFRKKIGALYLPKKIVSPPDKHTIDARIKQLDESSRIFPFSRPLGGGQNQEKFIRDRIEAYSSKMEVNKSDGTIQLSEDGQHFRISRIESQFEIQEENIMKDARSLSPNKIEGLLNQAADLLDRGICDRSEWDEKAVKFLDLALELEEFKEMDALLQRQVTAGLYERDLIKTKIDLDAQTVTQRKAAMAETQMKKLVTERFGVKSLKEQQDSLRRVNTSYFFAGFHADGGAPYEHAVPFDDEVAAIREFVNRGALEINQFNFAVQEELNKIQLRQLEANETVASKTKAYFLDKLNWEKKNITFREEHDRISRSTSMSKLSSFLAEDGLLNYTKRLIPLRERFDADFKEAYTKLKAAEYGMKSIYGFAEVLPAFKSGNVQFFDDCVIWNRKAISYINKSAETQTQVSIPVSLRSLFPDYDSFANCYATGKWDFELDGEFFKNKYQVRLLGVSLSIVGLGKDYRNPFNLEGCFRGIISNPKSGTYVQKGGKETVLDLSEYPAVPEVRIGNVFSVDGLRPPEIAGTQMLTNLSPIGKWTITLRPVSRPFRYEWKKNGKIRKISLMKDQPDNDSSDLAVNDGNLTDTLSEHSLKLTPGDPYFSPSDFWDLKLDVHVAFLS